MFRIIADCELITVLLTNVNSRHKTIFGVHKVHSVNEDAYFGS